MFPEGSAPANGVLVVASCSLGPAVTTGRPDGKRQNNLRGKKDVLIESGPNLIFKSHTNIDIRDISDNDSSSMPTCISLASIAFEF